MNQEKPIEDAMIDDIASPDFLEDEAYWTSPAALAAAAAPPEDQGFQDMETLLANEAAKEAAREAAAEEKSARDPIYGLQRFMFKRNWDRAGRGSLNINESITGKRFSLVYDKDDRIGDVKQKISDNTGYEKDTLRLVFPPNILNDDSRTLESYGITKDQTIQLVRFGMGGYRRKKRRRKRKTKKRRKKKTKKRRKSRKKKTKRKRKYRKKRTRRKRGGNKQLSDKQTFLKEVKKNEKKLKPMFTDFMDRFIISKKTITFNMVLKEIENMKDSEFEKNINNIINNKSRSKKGGVLLPDPAHHLIGDDNVDTYNCVLFVIIVTVAISQIWFSSQWLRGERGVRFGLGPALEIMDDIMGPVLTFLNIFCRVWVLFHNHPPQLSTHLRRQDSARDIMQQINRVEPMIIRQRVLAGAPDSFDTVFSWQAMENYLHEIRQIVEQFENRYYAPADSTAGTKRGI